MIETHAHIYDPQYEEDREEMLNRAWQSGVKQIWMPNCDSSTLLEMLKISTKYPEKCLPMLGLHPCYVKENFESELRLLESYLDQHRFVAIGEIGMDLYWNQTYKEQQKEAFIIQCQWALERQLWIDIHSRNAFRETVTLIEKIGDSRLTGIFHCFSGTLEEARIAIDLGFKLGIGGVVTFKNGGLDKIIPHIGPEHIVLETDSPYLAPVPFRGKRNEVAYIDLVAQRIADLWQMPKQQAIDLTNHNAMKLLNPVEEITKV